MPQYFDISLKSILKELPQKFMKLLTGFETAKFLDVQFPSVTYRQPDLLLELPDDSLFHVEMQAQNDRNMECREFEYLYLIYCDFRKPVHQLVLYVGDEKLDMKNEIILPGLHFTFRIIDIRDIDCHELLESDDPADNILAILCKTDDADRTVRVIIAKLSELPIEERRNYIIKLITLARLRKGLTESVKREVEKMPVTVDMSTDIFYLEGMEKGLIEGERKGLFEGIEGMLELKFGLAGLELMNMVRTMNSIDKLEEFKNLIKKAVSTDELKEFLGNSV
ncbi:hypothetical protein [Candidatus Magnetomonas plexicatena]|uniref:hypothetical protein n=1 Tax=Candidatus Magnetomonas plexicatena TaxID=2552947 RepID=UPI001105162E|nr:hypothetical protein E2O03_003125 [Nitrospirales bacterium LBB_01]